MENGKTNGFLSNLNSAPISVLELPVQTLYNLIYNKNKLKKTAVMS